MIEGDMIRKAQSWYPERFCRIRTACRTGAADLDLDFHAAMITLDASRALKEHRTAYAEAMREKLRQRG